MKLRGFTIVELLVVIIVIAVLVTLSIVGYSGISSKATVTALQSDLTNAKKQLLSFQAQSATNSFPTAINCTNPSTTEICIRPTGSTAFTYNVNNSSNPPTFNLAATNSSIKYWINDSSGILTTPGMVTNGVVLYLDAGNPASYSGSGTTMYDLSGNNKNGSLNGAASYIAVNGGAISLAGTDSRIYSNLSSDILPMPDMTYEIVFKTAGLGSGMTQGGLVSLNYGMVSTINTSGMLNFYIWDGSSQALNMSTTGYSYFDNLWHHAVFSISGSTGYIYVDGQLKNSATANIASRTGTNIWSGMGMRFGDNPNDAYYRLKGLISVVRIYNRGVTQAEVTQNFNALRGRYGI